MAIQVWTLEEVVDLPTPSAPPRVVIPFWQQIRAMTHPNDAALLRP